MSDFFDPNYMERKVAIVATGTDEDRLIIARQFGLIVRAHLFVLLALAAHPNPQINQEARTWLEQIEAMAGDLSEEEE